MINFRVGTGSLIRRKWEIEDRGALCDRERKRKKKERESERDRQTDRQRENEISLLPTPSSFRPADHELIYAPLILREINTGAEKRVGYIFYIISRAYNVDNCDLR